MHPLCLSEDGCDQARTARRSPEPVEWPHRPERRGPRLTRALNSSARQFVVRCGGFGAFRRPAGTRGSHDGHVGQAFLQIRPGHRLLTGSRHSGSCATCMRPSPRRIASLIASQLSGIRLGELSRSFKVFSPSLGHFRSLANDCFAAR